MAQAANTNPVIRGDKYRQTHKASVIGVLGRKAPDVISRGSRFYNMDRWTARFFIHEMCAWARANPGCVPSHSDVRAWVTRANSKRVDFRAIVIANTPDKLPLRAALAITGGAYHEAFHTRYSRMADLDVYEIVPLVLSRWAKVKDWSKFEKALLQWSNIIEDIRIERRGREEFEGALVKLADLQDFILGQEEKGVEALRDHGGKPGALSVIEGVFRDVGLGYNTEKQRFVMDRYRQDNNKAVEMVLNGPLTPMLKKAIALSKTDDLGCIRVAMDVLAELAEQGGESEEDDQSQQGEPGDGEQKCPNCDADADKLKVRPKPDGKGGKVKGKGLVTCTVCGWQDEVDVEPKQPQSKKGDGDDPKTPEFEDFDDDSQDAGGSSDESDADEGDDVQDSSSDSSDSSEGDGSDDGSSGGGDADDSDADEGDDAQGGGDDQGDEDGGPSESKRDEDGDGSESGSDDSSNEKDSQTSQSGEDGDDGSDGDGAGNDGHAENTEHPGNDWSDVAEDAIDQAESGKDTGVMDGSEALEDAVGHEQGKEDKDIKGGEAPWRPYNPGLDEVVVVEASHQGRDHDDVVARRLTDSVKRESAWLRARLRSVVRSLEMTSTYHGTPKGRRLSPRYFVDSQAALRGGQQPNKAYYVKSTKVDMSMACAVVLDESSSMSHSLRDATRIMVALTEPFDALNAPTLALGFRNGQWGGQYRYDSVPTGVDEADEGRNQYHRFEGVYYDIFKGWHEKFNAVRYRFANTRATGSTPMSDGIQYGLDALSARDEAHRFLFVVTDGQPDGGHEPVIRQQIRLAKQAGIHIIGVGMGGGAQYVKTLFDDSVHSNSLQEIPKQLVAKLNELVDLRAGKRGRRIKR